MKQLFERKTNFKTLIKQEKGEQIRYYNAFFFGSYKGHGKRIKAIWNGLPVEHKPNQVDYVVVKKCLGFNRK